MGGEMQWRRGRDGNLELFLKSNSDGFWRHYKGHPMSQPDRSPDIASPGMATYQYLHKQGWKLLALREQDR